MGSSFRSEKCPLFIRYLSSERFKQDNRFFCFYQIYYYFSSYNKELTNYRGFLTIVVYNTHAQGGHPEAEK